MCSRSGPILLVEDNPMDVDLTQRAFTRQGIVNPLQVARDGAEALSFLSRWEAGETEPVLILLDLKLPKVNGLEVLDHIKRHPHYHSIPVVVLTTSNDERDVNGAYQKGANSYIVKPVDFNQFMQMVNQIDQYWLGLNVPACEI